MLPPLGQKLLIGELEQILLDTSRGADATEFVELLYDDIECHVESIHNRMELAARDLFTDDEIFTLNGENGLHLEADFGVPAANMPTAAKPLVRPDQRPLADELRWIEYLRSIAAPLPTRVITSYKAGATPRREQCLPGGVLRQRQRLHHPHRGPRPEGEVVRALYNFPPITVYDVQISIDDTY
ncbi:major capsid protein [Streptomyces umbrinus]|uniref:major capsid protein n=1 Tax=Streptomyces umbrinus TaxID=67370 RepID=UPI0033EA5FF7